MNTDTPRTDAEIEHLRLLRYHLTPQNNPQVGAEFARAIELETISLMDTIRNLEAENGRLHTRVGELEQEISLSPSRFQ